MTGSRRRGLGLLAAGALALCRSPAGGADPVAPPPAFAPEYDPPAPGSYDLPVIARIADHDVLDTEGHSESLRALKKGRLALVAFVYTACAEPEGCPLAGAVLQRLDRDLAADAKLQRRVRLVSLSFDPERDTPARMAELRRGFAPRTDWAFLTTAGEAAITPILADFGQQVAKLRWEDGSWSGLFRHVLKVYLLDEDDRVRAIYSSGFLDPKLVLADLRTLALEP